MPKDKSKGNAVQNMRMATPEEEAEVEVLLCKARVDYLVRLESELQKINRWSSRVIQDLQRARLAIFE